MIRAVTDIGTLYRALGNKPDVYTEKIRSFADAYGFGYDFCRFWAQDNSAVMCSYYGDCTVSVSDGLSGDRVEELSGFLSSGMFRRLLVPYPLSKAHGLAGLTDEAVLMRWTGDVKKYDVIDKEDIRSDVSIGQVYEIARTAFDIDPDTWYTDTSHMLRHGTAKLYMLEEGCCAVRMFASNGISYLSYVCTLPSRRGNGLAGRLLRGICTEETQNGNNVFIFCEEALAGFYEAVGFSRERR